MNTKVEDGCWSNPQPGTSQPQKSPALVTRAPTREGARRGRFWTLSTTCVTARKRCSIGLMKRAGSSITICGSFLTRR